VVGILELLLIEGNRQAKRVLLLHQAHGAKKEDPLCPNADIYVPMQTLMTAGGRRALWTLRGNAPCAQNYNAPK
jgi:hypothetical protein